MRMTERKFIGPATIKAARAAAMALIISSVHSGGYADEATLRIRADQPVRTLDRHRLLGSNFALWHEASQLFHPDLQSWMRELKPSYLRIPGGSWSDEYYWNGHGVWENGVFDMSRLKDGLWAVDYAEYAPGFRVQGPGRKPSDYHGNVDVRALHELIAGESAEPIVTVNAGSGAPEMAAEWVRWANQANAYHVRHWEVGNELEGAWELGHFLPDGSRMTGEIYARRFLEFAKAMKAVDPDILVGGPAAASDRGGFMEDLLRIAGEQVDFVTFHTYPVERHLDSELEIFTQMHGLRDAVARMRGWIERYVPARKDEIEIGITEWNSKVIEDRDTADLLNGLWTAAWVGEMFQAGVSFATQWDALTRTKTGGHGLFQFDDGQCLPKSQFWGLYLWSKFMGNELLDIRLDGPEHLFAFATRGEGVLQILFINASRESAVQVGLEIEGFTPVDSAAIAQLSHREYFWDPYHHRPLRSTAPVLRTVDGQTAKSPVIPPFSAVVVRIPARGTRDVLADQIRARGDGGLEIVLPSEAALDVPVEGWVLATPTSPEAGADARAELAVEGPANLSATSVRMGESAGRFYLEPTGEGLVTVHAKLGSLAATRELSITAVQERQILVWDFEKPQASWGAISSFTLASDDSMRPNQTVAAVMMDGRTPGPERDIALLFDPLPEDVERAKIGGVMFDLLVAPDFDCEDGNVALTVVLQSEGDHWIPLERIKLKEVAPGWQSFVIRLPDPKYLKVMPQVYGLRFQLYQAKDEKVPVQGGIYLDNIGFLLR